MKAGSLLRKKGFFAIFVGAVLFFPLATALAEDAAPAETPQPNESADQYGHRLLDGLNPASLRLCGTPSIFNNLSYYYCGGTAAADGTEYLGLSNFRIDYKKGDQIRCYVANVTVSDGSSVCSVTSNGVTSYTKSTSITGATQTCTDGSCNDSSGLANGIKNVVDSGTDSLLSSIGTGIVKVVGSAILALANFLLGIAGTLLNWVVIKTVFQFGSTIGNSPGVLIAWGIFRDIGNLVLLFGFIFMGIATILNTNTFSAKRALPSLIIFAILMNFSLFAAEAIIDGTNAVTSVMYAQANTDACLGGTGEGPVQAQGSGSQADNGGNGSLSDCAINYGLAGHIMQSTGLSTMWETSGSFTAEFFTYAGLALFASIGAVVMFAVSIMLVIRLVVLTFVMVAAPIGFAGFAIPPMRGFAKQWWDKLISQAIFAPVLFLLILVSLKITDSFSGSYGERGLAGALTQPNASVMGIVMIFVIVIGFLIASLMAARSLGAQGASFAINTATKGVRGTFGFAGGIAGRNTIGKGSQFAQKKYEAWMGKNGGKGVGRSLIRNLGIDEAVAGTLTAGQKAKFGSSKSLEDKQKRDKERKEVFEKAARKAQLQSDLDTALALPQGQDRDDKVAEILERMSTKELEELDALKKVGGSLDTLVQNLSPEKFSALVKDGGALSEQQKKALKESRFKDIRDQQAIINDPSKTQAEKDAARDAIKSRIKKYSVKDLENAPSNLFEDDEIAKNLSNSQRDDLLKNGKITPAAARKVRQFDPVEQINAAHAAGQVIPAGSIVRLNPKQVARLSREVLLTKEFAQVATPKMLQGIQERNEIDEATAKDIAKNIENFAPNSKADDYIKNNPAGMAYWS